jgi:uncharacterized zinc-type alcohol dehydrogenase-like protein
MCSNHKDESKNRLSCDTTSQEQGNTLSRREFIQSSAALGAGVMLSGASPLFAAIDSKEMNMNIKSRGYAAVDISGKLKPWSFERRPVGDNDVLIETRAASICHSDIHQMKGHWGRSNTPRSPVMRLSVLSPPWARTLPGSRSETVLASAVW